MKPTNKQIAWRKRSWLLLKLTGFINSADTQCCTDEELRAINSINSEIKKLLRNFDVNSSKLGFKVIR